MPVEVSYFSFDEIKTKVADSIAHFGEKLHLDQRVTVPYAVLRAVDLDSGEVLNDLTPYISGVSTTPERCWGLRCLTIYPALLALRTIACTLRGGNKPRHYAAAIRFAQQQGSSPYSDLDLLTHLSQAWKSSGATYQLVLQCIPPTQMPHFIEAAWRTAQLTQDLLDRADQETVDHLISLGLIPRPSLF